MWSEGCGLADDLVHMQLVCWTYLSEADTHNCAGVAKLAPSSLCCADAIFVVQVRAAVGDGRQ